MDFTFNEEQTLIQDQVDQFIQKEYDWETRQSLSNSDLGFGDDNWQKFAELGWLGISTSEDCGGFGGSAIESMLIMEAFGKGLVVEPFLETIIMCGGLLASNVGGAFKHLCDNRVNARPKHIVRHIKRVALCWYDDSLVHLFLNSLA